MFRPWGLKIDLAIHSVKAQPVGVQPVSMCVVSALAIHRVIDYRQAYAGQMHANLIGPAGTGRRFEQGPAVQRTQLLKMSDRFFRVSV